MSATTTVIAARIPEAQRAALVAEAVRRGVEFSDVLADFLAEYLPDFVADRVRADVGRPRPLGTVELEREGGGP